MDNTGVGDIWGFCIGFNIPFNRFQFISGQCLIVFRGHVSLTYHNADIFDLWYPTRSYFYGSRSTSFGVEVPFLCRTLDKGASTTNSKSLVWLGQELNPGPPTHGGECCTTRLAVLQSYTVKEQITYWELQILSYWLNSCQTAFHGLCGKCRNILRWIDTHFVQINKFWISIVHIEYIYTASFAATKHAERQNKQESLCWCLKICVSKLENHNSVTIKLTVN